MRENGGKEAQGGRWISRSSGLLRVAIECCGEMEKTPDQGVSKKRHFGLQDHRPARTTQGYGSGLQCPLYMFMCITTTLNPTTPNTTTIRSPSNLTYTHSCWIPKQGSLPALHQGSELFIAGPLQRVSGSAGWNDIYGAPWARVGRTEGETELGVRWEGRVGD